MEVNLNQFVRFKLTAYGAQILRNDNERWKGFEFYRPKVFTAGQEHEMPLWSFMSLFGPYLAPGSQIPAENCALTILNDNERQQHGNRQETNPRQEIRCAC